MDVKQDDFFEEFKQENPPMVEDTPIKLPLPNEDFDEYGRVKKLRGRILKKLLKQEWKFYFPIMSLLSLLVLVAGLVFSVLLRIMINKPEAFDNNFFPFFFISWTVVYVYGMAGMSLFTMIYPVVRYNKNFFQSEGYLTFSIPASMEEHLYAKRIAAVICQAVSIVVLLLSLTILFLVIGNVPQVLDGLKQAFGAIGEAIVLEPVHGVFFCIEIVLTMLIGLVMSPCIYGAASCFLSKTTGKKKLAVSILLVFLVVGVIESVISGITSVIMIPLMHLGAVGLHIQLWLGILVNAAVTVACFLFELNFLKKKLDLK